MSSPLLSERRGGALVLTLSRPERKNALSGELVDALLAAVRAPGDARVIVITGAGPLFCAGGDLGANADEGLFQQHKGRLAFAELLLALHQSPVPVIAAVNGDALGGGFGLVASAHLIVADERARFATPELKVGLFPWMISPVLLRNLPRKLVHDLVLTGRKLAAPEAHALGFVNRLAPPGEALDHALRLAEEAGAWSPAVLAMGLPAMGSEAELPLGTALHHMHAQLSLNLLLDDAAEGISAFLGRRAPVWKGR